MEELRKKIEEIQKHAEELQKDFDKLKNQATIPFEVEQAFRGRLDNLLGSFPSALTSAPLSSVTSPSGGATVDSQARTAIDTIITRLEDLGLIIAN